MRTAKFPRQQRRCVGPGFTPTLLRDMLGETREIDPYEGWNKSVRGAKIPGIKSPLIPTKTITLLLLGRHPKLWPNHFGPGCRKLPHIYRGHCMNAVGTKGTKRAFMYSLEYFEREKINYLKSTGTVSFLG